MKRSALFSVMLACAIGAAAGGVAAQPTEVEGVKLEPTAQVGGATLVLNGAGVRTRAFFKVYVGALYVPSRSRDAATLLAQKGPRRMVLTMLRDVGADSFSGALNDGLKANLGEQQLSAFRPQIEALNASLKAVGEVKKGDVIHFEFTPETGTRITVNGQPRGAAIAGEEFFSAVLRVWLGEQPVDAGLKKGLLGG